jgi:hypothetical protein
MIKGIAVMNTTKIVVALEIPNQMIAKIAQIADETVFNTGRTGSKNSPARLFAPRKMPSGKPVSAANTNPTTTRQSVIARLFHKSPFAAISRRASQTRSGPGKT